MSHQEEIELKFELDSDGVGKVRNHALLEKADHRTWLQRTTYFDTGNGKLRKKGYSLRVRQVGDHFIQTVKTNSRSAGLFGREEWESAVRRMAPDPRALEHTPLAKLGCLVRLEPVSRFEVQRTCWAVNVDGSSIEVVLDSGRYSSGRRKAPIHELEIELKKGRARTLFSFARKLSDAAQLRIGVLSKDERGFMLARNMSGQGQASALAVRKNMEVREAVVLFVHECVRHFRLNEPAIVSRRDSEALHQARVAIRRLRSVFSFFRPAIRRETLDPLRKELRSFFEPFGRARNLDVFLARYRGELPLADRRKLSRARDDAYDEVVGAMASQRGRDLFLGLVEWAASRHWATGNATHPLGNLAGKQLDIMWRKIERKCSILPDLEESQLHRLRIAIKNMRYTLEFMAPLYSKKEIRKFTEGLERTQNCLGELHDEMSARQLIEALSLHRPSGYGGDDRSRSVEEAEADFKRLKRLRRVWRR